MQQHYRFDDSRAAYEQIEEELLIIDLQTGAYFSLRETAAALWLNAVIGMPGRRLAQALHTQYPTADVDTVARDVDTFLNVLVEAGLLVPAADVSDAAPVWDIPLPATYRAPVVERYDDMQALLLIDPIHDVDMTGWPALPPAATPTDVIRIDAKPEDATPGQVAPRAGR